MSTSDDRWLWFIDDGPLQALLRAEGIVPEANKRAASSPELVRAMAMYLEGRRADAVAAIEKALQTAPPATQCAELAGALGQMHFEKCAVRATQAAEGIERFHHACAFRPACADAPSK